MRFLLILFSLTLFSCSFGGFKPAPQHYHWRLHNADALFPESDPNVLTKYVDRKEKDMKDCGMDFVTGESDDPIEYY